MGPRTYRHCLLDSTGEQVAEQECRPNGGSSIWETATEPPEGNPPRPFDQLRATPPERGAEEAPPAELTPETVSEETPQTETSTSPHPDPLPEGEGEGASSTPDASSEETAAVIEDTPSTETATPAATETPPVTTAANSPNPQPPTPNSPPFPSRCVFLSLRADFFDLKRRSLRFLWPTRKLRMCSLSHPVCCSWSPRPWAGHRWLHSMLTASWSASGP